MASLINVAGETEFFTKSRSIRALISPSSLSPLSALLQRQLAKQRTSIKKFVHSFRLSRVCLRLFDRRAKFFFVFFKEIQIFPTLLEVFQRVQKYIVCTIGR